MPGTAWSLRRVDGRVSTCTRAEWAISRMAADSKPDKDLDQRIRATRAGDACLRFSVPSLDCAIVGAVSAGLECLRRAESEAAGCGMQRGELWLRRAEQWAR